MPSFEDLEKAVEETTGKKSKRKRNTKAWKDFEQAVSRSIGTERNALSGAWKGLSGSDTLHHALYVEAKYRALMKFDVDLSRYVATIATETGEIWIFRNDLNPLKTPHLPHKPRTFARSLLIETAEKAAQEEKTPIVVLKQRGMKGWYFVLFSHDYHTLTKYYGIKKE